VCVCDHSLTDALSVALAALLVAHAHPAQAAGFLQHADDTRGWHMPPRVEKEVAQEDCVCVCVCDHSLTDALSVALAALPAAHAHLAQATGFLHHADTTRGRHMPFMAVRAREEGEFP
jgi:predicted nucleic acid-binding protein